MKPYEKFTDKYGNEYHFKSYTDFAAFWFGIGRKAAKIYFPNFYELQKYACNSKEARKKICQKRP